MDNKQQGKTRLKDARKKKKKKKKKNKRRCAHAACRKKLLLTDTACRCGETYCSAHRLPEVHVCPFDYKAFDKGQFIAAAGLGGGVPGKLVTI
jgi:predicted nucleic acid binding AN1-type Zn finger protein